jgi:hypothetical protein
MKRETIAVVISTLLLLLLVSAMSHAEEVKRKAPKSYSTYHLTGPSKAQIKQRIKACNGHKKKPRRVVYNPQRGYRHYAWAK